MYKLSDFKIYLHKKLILLKCYMWVIFYKWLKLRIMLLKIKKYWNLIENNKLIVKNNFHNWNLKDWFIWHLVNEITEFLMKKVYDLLHNL